MSIIKKPYEISIWDNIWKEGEVTEKKIMVIGSDTMTTKCRAVEPQLTTNVNGTVTFTFKMYTQYFDSEKSVYLENPIIPYLVNERLVKVHYDGEWYDLVIKNIEESSDQKSFIYTCKSLHISELGKNGFNLEFNTELENNMGTIFDLAGKVVEGTDWTIDKNNSDIIRAYKPEQIFQADLGKLNSKSLTATVMLDTKKQVTFSSTDTLYIFYSSILDWKETGELQVLTIKDDSEILIDDEGIIVSDGNSNNAGATIQNALIKTTPEIIEKQILANYSATSYKAYRLVKQKQLKYDSKTDKYVEVGKDKSGKKIYKYTDTEYLTPTFVKNLISNSSKFSSTASWIAQSSQNNSDDDEEETMCKIELASYDETGEGQISFNEVPLKGEEGSQQVDIPNVEEIGNFVSVLKISNFIEGTSFYNVGLTANRTVIKNFEQGENYAFAIKLLGSSDNIVSDINRVFTMTVTGVANTDALFTTSGQNPVWNGSASTNNLKYSYLIYKLPCKRAVTESELRNSLFRINFLKNNGTFEEFQIVDIEFFKWYDLPQENGTTDSKRCILPVGSDIVNWKNGSGNFSTEEEQNKLYGVTKDSTTQNKTVSASKYSIDHEYYYYPDDNSATTTADEIQYCKPDGYTPLYNDENDYQKVTSIEISESNRFNIIQTLCEKFECWAEFKIDHAKDGTITKRAIRFKEYIGNFNYVGFKYGINLQSIQRTIDSEQISTKVIVKDNTNEHATDGFCTISRVKDNPTGQNFILDFSYYIQQGLLNQQALEDDLYNNFTYPEKPEGEKTGYYTLAREAANERDELIRKLSDLQISELSAQSDVTAYEEAYAAAQEEEAKNINNYNTYTRCTWPEYQPVMVEHTETKEDGTTEKKTVDSRMADPTLLNYISAITQARKAAADAKANLAIAQDRLDTIEKSITSILDALKANKLNDLNDAFFMKYRKFIQEGTWTSQDYYDDSLYYWDALDVARTSAKPQVTYNISVIDISALPDYSAYAAHLGDRTTIEDTEFFGYVTKHASDGSIYKEPYKEEIVVTELTSNFDSPELDEIKVQNYKTQFDDLFQRVVASSQALEYASGSYQRAADAILEGKELRHDYLQNAIDKNAIILKNSVNESVVWDNTGITITDTTNSAYILRLVSRGLMLTADGGETWVTGIRGDGINADYITTGRLDTGKVVIITGGIETFTWDSYGLTAYAWSNTLGKDGREFVRFDQYGIYCIKNDPNFSADALNASNQTGIDKIKALTLEENPFYLLRDGSLRIKGDIYANSLTLVGEDGEEEDHPITREDTMYGLFEQKIEGYNFDEYLQAETDDQGLLYGNDIKVTDKTKPYWSYTQPALIPNYSLIQRHRVFKFDGKNSFESFYTDLTSSYSKNNNNMLRGTADPIIQETDEADNWVLGQWRLTSGGTGTGSKINFKSQGEDVAPFPGLKSYLQIANNTSGNRDFMQHPVRGFIHKKLYTFSLYARTKVADAAGKITLLVRLWNQIEGSGDEPMYSHTFKDVDTTWKLYYSTFEYPLESDDTHISVQFGIQGTGSIQLCGFKLEPGKVQTPQWTPSPYDLDNRVISTVYHYYSAKRNEDGTFNKPDYDSSGWTETLPTLSANDPIIWYYFEQTYADGTTYRSEIYVLSTYGRDGTNGKNGSPGKDGKTIIDIKQYFYKGKTAPEQDNAGWTTQIPTGIRDSDIYWTYIKYFYSDSTSTTSETTRWDAQQFYEDLLYSGSLIEYDENGDYIRGSYDPLLTYKESTMSYMGTDVPIVIVYKKGDPDSEIQWRVRRQGLVIGDNAVILGTVLASNGIFVGDVRARDLTIERGLSVGTTSTTNLLTEMDTSSMMADDILDRSSGTDHQPKQIKNTNKFSTPYPDKFGETYLAGDDYTYDSSKGNDDRKKYVVYYDRCEKGQVETFIYTRHTDSPVNKHVIYQLEFKVKVSATPMHYSVRVVYYSIENSKVKLLHEDPVTILEEDTTNYIPDRWVTKKVAFTTEEGSKPNRDGGTQVETSTDWATDYTYIGFRFDNDGIIRDDYTTANTTHTTLRICDLKLTEGAFGLDKNGTLVAKSGYIGGWNIGNKKLYASYYDPTDNKSYVSAIQAPQPGSPEWVFAAGGTGHNSYADALFRVNKKGQLWATGAHISGTIICGNDSTFGGKKPATWEDSINGATNTANGAQNAAKNAQDTADEAKDAITSLDDDYTKFLGAGARSNLLPLSHPFANDKEGYEKGLVKHGWSNTSQERGYILPDPTTGYLFVLQIPNKKATKDEKFFYSARADLISANKNTTYTFSISLRRSGQSEYTPKVNYEIYYFISDKTTKELVNNGDYSDSTYLNEHGFALLTKGTVTTDTWQRKAVSFQIPANAKSIYFRIDNHGQDQNQLQDGSSVLYIAYMQLELGNTAGKGNKALTPYSPSPNDPYAQGLFLSLGGVLVTDKNGFITGHAPHITYSTSGNNLKLHYKDGDQTYDATVPKEGLVVCENMVVAGTIFGSQGKIGGWTITSHKLMATYTEGGKDYCMGLQVPYIDEEGKPVGNTVLAIGSPSHSNYTTNGKFYVNKYGEFWATNAHITGEISAGSTINDSGNKYELGDILSGTDTNLLICGHPLIDDSDATTYQQYLVKGDDADVIPGWRYKQANYVWPDKDYGYVFILEQTSAEDGNPWLNTARVDLPGGDSGTKYMFSMEARIWNTAEYENESTISVYYGLSSKTSVKLGYHSNNQDVKNVSANIPDTSSAHFISQKVNKNGWTKINKVITIPTDSKSIWFRIVLINISGKKQAVKIAHMQLIPGETIRPYTIPSNDPLNQEGLLTNGHVLRTDDEGNLKGDFGCSYTIKKTENDNITIHFSGDSDNTNYVVPRKGLIMANNALIRGTVIASNGLIGGWEITSHKLMATYTETEKDGTIVNYCMGLQVPYIDKDGKPVGSTVLAIGSPSHENYTTNGKFYVNKYGEFWATNAHITGQVNATSGKVGGWTIEENNLSHSNYSVGVSPGSLLINNKKHCFWAGFDNTAINKVEPPFYVLDDGSLYATSAHITGQINATSGQIAKWGIHDHDLSYDNYKVGMSPGADLINNKTMHCFWAGYKHGSGTEPPFYVTQDGALFATDVHITGEIDATSGPTKTGIDGAKNAADGAKNAADAAKKAADTANQAAKNASDAFTNYKKTSSVNKLICGHPLTGNLDKYKQYLVKKGWDGSNNNGYINSDATTGYYFLLNKPDSKNNTYHFYTARTNIVGGYTYTLSFLASPFISSNYNQTISFDVEYGLSTQTVEALGWTSEDNDLSQYTNNKMHKTVQDTWTKFTWKIEVPSQVNSKSPKSISFRFQIADNTKPSTNSQASLKLAYIQLTPGTIEREYQVAPDDPMILESFVENGGVLRVDDNGTLKDGYAPNVTEKTTQDQLNEGKRSFSIDGKNYVVSKNGLIVATNIVTRGTIIATAGIFGGLEIGQVTVKTNSNQEIVNALHSVTDEKGIKMTLYPGGHSLAPWGTYGRNFLNIGKSDIFSDPSTDTCISDIAGVTSIYTPSMVTKRIQCSEFYMYNSSSAVTLKVSRQLDSQSWGYTHISGGEPAATGHQTRYGGIFFGSANSNPALSTNDNNYCKIVNYADNLIITHKARVYITSKYQEKGAPAILIDTSSGNLTGTWTLNSTTAVTSDRNLKHSISLLPDSYSTLFDNLKPVIYKYNDGQSDRFHTGFIAQDVEEAILSAGLTTQDFAGFMKCAESIRDPNNPENYLDETRDVYYLRYNEFIALNTYEVQKLKKRIIELENHISALENRAF